MLGCEMKGESIEDQSRKGKEVENMLKILDFLEYSSDYVSYDEEILNRSLELEKHGLMGMDAVQS